MTTKPKDDWDVIAVAWLKWNDSREVCYLPVSQRMITAAGIKAGDRVLDIATGCGEPALTVASVVGAKGQVLGVDAAPHMLEAAEQRARSNGVTNVRFRLMDGVGLPVPDASFDAVLCRWGAMFFPKPLETMTDIRRALRPGGKVAFVVWDAPEKNAAVGVPMKMARQVLGLPSPDPSAPNISSFSEPGSLERVLQQAGFKAIQAEHLRHLYRDMASAEELWESTVETSAGLKNAVERAPQELQEQVRREVIEAVRKDYTAEDGRVRMYGASILVSAAK